MTYVVSDWVAVEMLEGRDESTMKPTAGYLGVGYEDSMNPPRRIFGEVADYPELGATFTQRCYEMNQYFDMAPLEREGLAIGAGGMGYSRTVVPAAQMAKAIDSLGVRTFLNDPAVRVQRDINSCRRLLAEPGDRDSSSRQGLNVEEELAALQERLPQAQAESSRLSAEAIDRMRRITGLRGVGVGDEVLLKRNLEHPAWNVRSEDEYGDIRYEPKPDVDEVIGVVQVVEVADLGLTRGQCLRMSSGNWFRMDGFQEGSEATMVVPLSPEAEQHIGLENVDLQAAESAVMARRDYREQREHLQRLVDNWNPDSPAMKPKIEQYQHVLDSAERLMDRFNNVRGAEAAEGISGVTQFLAKRVIEADPQHATRVQVERRLARDTPLMPTTPSMSPVTESVGPSL